MPIGDDATVRKGPIVSGLKSVKYGFSPMGFTRCRWIETVNRPTSEYRCVYEAISAAATFVGYSIE